jgi:hypothetical protein
VLLKDKKFALIGLILLLFTIQPKGASYMKAKVMSVKLRLILGYQENARQEIS